MCSKIFFMYCLFWGKRHVSLLLKAQKAKDYLCSVSFQNFEKGSMMQKGLLKFACYPDCFVLANRFNRLLLHHVCHCKHSPHAMPAPSKECCVYHSPSRLVYQPLQQDPRDLADPECKETRIQVQLRQKLFTLGEPQIRLNRAHSYLPGSREGQQDLFHPFHLGCPGWNKNQVINLEEEIQGSRL